MEVEDVLNLEHDGGTSQSANGRSLGIIRGAETAWRRPSLSSQLAKLSLKRGGDLGELVEGGLEVLGDFGGDDVGIGQVRRVL